MNNQQNKANANTSQSKATNSAGSESSDEDDGQDPNKTHEEPKFYADTAEKAPEEK